MDEDYYTSDYFSFSSNSSNSEGELHCKVDINHDGTHRTRYYYFEKEVVDLTIASHHDNEMASIIRFVFTAFFSKKYYLLVLILRKNNENINLITL